MMHLLVLLDKFKDLKLVRDRLSIRMNAFKTKDMPMREFFKNKTHLQIYFVKRFSNKA